MINSLTHKRINLQALQITVINCRHLCNNSIWRKTWLLHRRGRLHHSNVGANAP